MTQGYPRRYTFNGQQWQDEFNLNVTAMDFRQYDNALSRFYSPDALSELTYDQTPYRFGFNNPAFWSDPTGLFENRNAAKAFAMLNGIDPSDYRITRNLESGGFNLVVTGGEFNGETFYGFSEELDEIFIEVARGGGGSGDAPKDPGYNPFGIVFTTTNGENGPVKPSRGPRNAMFFDADYIYFWASIYGPKTTVGYQTNYEDKKKKTQYKEPYEYDTYRAVPSWMGDKLILRATTLTVHLTPTEYHKTDWDRKAMIDSIMAVEEIKRHEVSRIHFEESIKNK